MKNESQRDFDDRPSPEGIAGRAFAIERPAQSPPTALRDAAGNLARKVDHDPNGDGKQANCMRERDEEGIRSGENPPLARRRRPFGRKVGPHEEMRLLGRFASSAEAGLAQWRPSPVLDGALGQKPGETFRAQPYGAAPAHRIERLPIVWAHAADRLGRQGTKIKCSRSS